MISNELLYPNSLFNDSIIFKIYKPMWFSKDNRKNENIQEKRLGFFYDLSFISDNEGFWNREK